MQIPNLSKRLFVVFRNQGPSTKDFKSKATTHNIMLLLNKMLKIALAVSLVLCTRAQPPRGRGKGISFLVPLRPSRDGGPGQDPDEECADVVCRTLTGRCTSTTDSSWGEARFAQFSYIPGSSSETPSGQTRKSAREISNIVSTQTVDTVNARGLNQLFVFFGQFLDHNLIATPEGEEPFDIPVSDSDQDLSVDSLPFRRSVRGEAETSSTSRPVNTLTSAIDLDAVYAPNEERNLELLELDDAGQMTGKLKTSGDSLLPLNLNGFFNAPDTSDRFFLAGDHRPNEHPVLTCMHTIFLREHNRLVDKVLSRLPDLERGEVYEFARKLNIAQYQKIVYEEFYPAIIGRPLPQYTGFRSGVDPTVSDVFGGAAFRIGHTLVSNTIPRQGPSGALEPVPMADIFFRPADTFSSSELENIVRGTANTLAQEVDAKVVDALRNMLFDNVADEEGFDLVALNLQRGRDHALPTYNEVRQLFGLPRVTGFDAITSDTDTAAKLAEAYDNNIDEVEAFLGLISEDHVPSSSVGPTMAAVWATEFTRLRDGDQFFYLRTEMLPSLLTSTFPECVRDLTTGRDLFRDIIIRNTGITADQLPRGAIFTI